MKKNQKNSTGIMLVAVQTEKNQKQKRIENFIDGLLVWIFAMLTGIAVCNMFGIKVNALPAIAGIVFAVYLSFEKICTACRRFGADTGASPLS